MTAFCRACGLPLDLKWRKWNRRFRGPEGSHRVYCSDQCEKTYRLARKHKPIPKHGAIAF